MMTTVERLDLGVSERCIDSERFSSRFRPEAVARADRR
jgi:hypothetical protein